MRASFDERSRAVTETGELVRYSAVGLAALLFVVGAFLFRKLSRANDAARRFVPYELRELLDKSDLAALQRGTRLELTLTVLFADLRGFTAMSAGRPPSEIFSAINAYHATMEAAIKANGGFIHQFLGDGIMALFPRAPGTARTKR